VPSPVTPPPLPPSRPPGSAPLLRSAPRKNAGPQCERAAPMSSLGCGPWQEAALCTRHAPGATEHAHPKVEQSPTEGERRSVAQTEGRG
jgi:hypothetical protein